MDFTESDAINVAKREVFKWEYLASSQRDIDALHRLVDHPEARVAWDRLASKNLRRYPFSYVASMIGRSAVASQLDPGQKKTQREIAEAASEAATLAEKLVLLITNNATLRNMGEDLIPPPEKAALDRILGGVLKQHLRAYKRGKTNDPDAWFAPEIEGELNQQQVVSSPEFAGMTTSAAYRILRWETISDDGFVERLKLFAQLARESAHFEPILPRPNVDSTDQHVFALNVCSTLTYHYGAPYYEIVAGFTSAVFNQPIDAQVVKKWWQRRGDSSDPTI